jgi:tellurite resistance protein TehA-like permease
MRRFRRRYASYAALAFAVSRRNTRVFVGSRNRTNSALVFGIVLSYLWLIHWFWLRGVLSEDDKPIVDTKLAGTLEISASQTSNGPGK